MITTILTQPEYHFLRLAFLLSAIASLSFGLIGTFVVVRRIGYLAGAISHCAFGGIGFGLWLKQTLLLYLCGVSGTMMTQSTAAVAASSPEEGAGQTPPFLETLVQWFDPIWMAILVAVGAALIIGVVQRRFREREDTLIGIIWSLGMAIGLLFLDRTTGYVSISGYLFGDILLISRQDMITVAVLGFFVILITTVFFKRMEAVCFDEEFARLRGIHVDFWFRLLLILTAITVVLMLRIVGMVLVIALLTLPAATAARLTQRLSTMIFLAILFCFFGSWLGIYLSFRWNFSAGPMIILVISLVYAVVLGVEKVRQRIWFS